MFIDKISFDIFYTSLDASIEEVKAEYRFRHVFYISSYFFYETANIIFLNALQPSSS